MTVSLHVVEKLLIVSRMSKVDYQNKVLPTFYFNTSVNLMTPFFFLGEDIQITLYGDSTDINVGLDKNFVMLEKTYISLATNQKVAIMNRSDSIVHYQWKNFATEEAEERDKLRFDLY